MGQNRNYQFFKPPQIQDPIIKSNWNPRKSPAENLKAMGLRSLPNISVNSRGRNMEEYGSTNAKSKESNKKCIELFDIPDSDIIPKKTLAQRMLPVSIDNQKYMAKCFAKHGDDYLKMSRDIKVNNMQHTENQLRKLGARFLLLSEGERRVEIPDKIQHLMC